MRLFCQNMRFLCAKNPEYAELCAKKIEIMRYQYGYRFNGNRKGNSIVTSKIQSGETSKFLIELL